MNSKIKLLPHNERLYNEIKKHIDTGERSIFYSEATGLGKSFIFMRLVEEYFSGKNILYIVPKIAIWENLIHYNEFSLLDANIEMTTFTAFNTYNTEGKLYEKYDAVFVDECHHMLSEIQGMNIAIFLEDVYNYGKYAFGLTATPEYDGVFVDEIYFKVSCYGYDVFEAIENNIFPKIDVAVADIDFDSIPDDLCKKFSVVGTKSILEQIIEERKDITHWLAYFGRKSDLNESERELQALFPEFKIVKIYRGLGNISEIIKYFEEYDGKIILMSVSMLLEGMHLNNVGGVMLYRNVGVRNTYFQIYGRLCKMGSSVAPLFLDVTGSILNLTDDDLNMFKSVKYRVSTKKYSRRDIFNVTSKTYKYIELSDAMNPFRLKEYRGIKWTTLKSLDKALYMSIGYTSLTTRLKNIKAEDVIDNLLGDKSYEEYIESLNKKQTITICNKVYEYHTIGELVNKIGRDTNVRCISSSKLKNYVDLIEWEHSKGFIIGSEYKGFDITSTSTVGRKMSVQPTSLKWFIDEENISVTECIDMYLNKDRWYMGIMPMSWVKEVAKRSNVSIANVKRRYYMIGNSKDTIDYFLSGSVYYRGVNITQRTVSAESISKEINVPACNIASWLKRNNYDVKACIDYYLDKGKPKEKKGKIVTKKKELGPREYTDKELETMYTERNNGTEWSDIVDILNGFESNISRGIVRTVCPCITRYNRYLKEVKNEKSESRVLHKYSVDEMNTIKDMRENGAAWKEVADALNNMEYNKANGIVRKAVTVAGMYSRYLRLTKDT